MAKRVGEKTKSDIPFRKTNNLLDKLSSYKNFRSSKKFYIILIIAGLVLLFIYKKNWFVAATVNGSPITNLELQMKLNKQFRTQMLNQLINEKIILTEVMKKNTVVSEAEVSNKISEIEKSVGGAESLNALLSQQGQTRDGIREQIRLQLSIEKLYANEASVSGEEVAAFIEQNSDQLRATDSAGQEKEAAELIKSQKLSQIFSQKFQELKQRAKVQVF
ncbi:SurA N-terminal domain-containing protein [Candidatus Daviesbacteria bacterium]|nr:SurA N-terminal domain-containing protein [Candidatus Daviesbacteria bacterium]